MRSKIAVCFVLACMITTIVVMYNTIRKWKERANISKKNENKHFNMFDAMNQWVRKNHEGKKLADHLMAKGYRTIAVYGMGAIGDTLIEELDGSGVEVKYGIDQNARELYSELDIYTMDDELEDVDAVIVTAISAYDSIKAKLETRVTCPILAIDDVINEM